MQVTVLFAVVVVAAFFVAIVIGLAWFIAVPIAVVLLLLPVAYTMALMFRRRSEAVPPPRETTDLPTSDEASYDPVPDPSERGTTPR